MYGLFECMILWLESECGVAAVRRIQSVAIAAVSKGDLDRLQLSERCVRSFEVLASVPTCPPDQHPVQERDLLISRDVSWVSCRLLR